VWTARLPDPSPCGAETGDSILREWICIGVLAARSARGLQLSFAPLEKRGRRECRMRAAPAVSCAMCTKRCAHEHTGSAEAIRHSLRNGFTAYSALSPVIGFLATVIGGTYRQLDASTEASGPHVFAVRFRAVRQRRIRVHRSLSHVRDDGRLPSWRDRMAIDVPLICPAAKAKYF